MTPQIWILIFTLFPTVWKQSRQRPVQGKGSTHLRLPWLPQSCNQGMTRWASAGLPKSWNSSGKSHLAASCFYSFQPFISEHSVLLKLPLASQRYMYLFVNKFSLCLISNPNNFYNISFPLYALMAWTLIFRSTLSPSQTSLKPDGQGMPKMFILQMLKYRVF